jgi:ribosomal protein S18 acetylase RimI-like enzyme
MPISVRPVTELDLDPITRIDERIRGSWRPEEWESRVRYYIRRDPEGSFVVELDGQVVGFMLGEVRGGEFGLEEKTGWVEVLGVDPEHRGKELGKALAEAMLARFKAQGVTCVRTLVGETQEPIRRFFTSLGFEPEPLHPLALRI